MKTLNILIKNELYYCVIINVCDEFFNLRCFENEEDAEEYSLSMKDLL